MDATGSVGAEGQLSLESARLEASVGVPGVSLQARGTASAAPGGGLSLAGSADLRLLGLPSLHAQGTGTATSNGVDFAGRFSGAGPLFTSYITGRFDLSTSRGISASAGVFGLTYSPGLSLKDPSPPSPGLLAIAGRAEGSLDAWRADARGVLLPLLAGAAELPLGGDHARSQLATDRRTSASA